MVVLYVSEWLHALCKLLIRLFSVCHPLPAATPCLQRHKGYWLRATGDELRGAGKLKYFVDVELAHVSRMAAYCYIFNDFIYHRGKENTE